MAQAGLKLTEILVSQPPGAGVTRGPPRPAHWQILLSPGLLVLQKTRLAWEGPGRRTGRLTQDTRAFPRGPHGHMRLQRLGLRGAFLEDVEGGRVQVAAQEEPRRASWRR